MHHNSNWFISYAPKTYLVRSWWPYQIPINWSLSPSEQGSIEISRHPWPSGQTSKSNKVILHSKFIFLQYLTRCLRRYCMLLQNGMDRQTESQPKKHNASSPGCRRHKKRHKNCSQLQGSSGRLEGSCIEGGNSLPVRCRDFYKLWKLLWTKPQQHKNSQVPCSLYIRGRQGAFHFSPAECQTGYQTQRTNER